MANKITINSRKYNGHIHRSWNGILIERNSDLLIASGTFENEILHSSLGLIKKGTTSVEYFWFDSWFNVFRFHHPEGELRNYYCNIIMPPSFQNSTLDYVDLDIDILVWDNLSSEILDIEEFAENSIRFNYSEELKKKVNETINELTEMIKTREFPFDYIK